VNVNVDQPWRNHHTCHGNNFGLGSAGTRIVEAGNSAIHNENISKAIHILRGVYHSTAGY
jgi:hypothetical protein